MTIFRQPKPGDWATVMHRAAVSLASPAALRINPAATFASAA